jgi:polyhydroxybutyrate depolymerase
MDAGPTKEARRARRLRLATAMAVLCAVLAYFAYPRVRARFSRGTAVRVSARGGESPILADIRYGGPSKPATVSAQSLRVGDRIRSYVEVVPPRLSSDAPALVLVLHGDGGDAQSFHRGFPFEAASGDGAVVAYLDGLRATWDLESAEGENGDEAFVVALARELTTRHGLHDVFGAAYSSGGFLLNLVACRNPTLFRAIATHAAGGPYAEAGRYPNGYVKCARQGPVAMMALHGTSDFAVPLSGGKFSAAYWAYVNGCSTTDAETTGYPECYAYQGCPPGKAVAYCEIPGLGHWVWDKGAAASWTFFQAARSR